MKRTALVIGAAQAVLFSVPFFAWKAAWGGLLFARRASERRRRALDARQQTAVYYTKYARMCA